MKILKTRLILFLLIASISLNAQSPYELNWKREIAITGTGLATGLLGLQLRSSVPLYTASGVAALDAADINSFDRNTVNNYSVSAHNASNLFLYGSCSTPLLLLPVRQIRNSYGTVAVLWGETAMVTLGLTVLTKYAIRRTRPYVYNPSVPLDKKMGANAKGSFFSGHTSITAANLFFAAKVLTDYYPDNKLNPLIWSVAGVVPAVTGYLRVRGGRHFPTDVITGYIVGAITGFAIPHIHKKKAGPDSKLSFQAGFNGVGLQWSIR